MPVLSPHRAVQFAGWALWAAALVACGAWPAVGEPVVEEPAPQEVPLTPLDREHWAFQPVLQPVPPSVDGAGWCRTPVDRFILRELERRGLSPMPEADRATLLRRVTFDLTGLPPTPEELRRFLNDPAPDAWERVVDRLLASPSAGERAAQQWLDLVRFAETDGFEHDHLRPQAWRYRDWVIAAFNADLPFDRFVTLQLAADELAPQELSSPDDLLATGFLLAGPDMPDLNLQQERRHVVLNGMTANVGEVLLGLQFGCAQCHDHKADPLSQRDFYRLRACFETIDLFQEPKLHLTGVSGLAGDAVPVRATVNAARSSEPSRLWIRGDFRRPGPIVSPAPPRIASGSSTANAFRGTTSHPRRDLAAWIVAPDNPLTARVVVNRIWQQHFGVGLVATASDFGLLGQEPTHPELLDWLATELVRSGWSLKQLRRLLAMSAVYRCSSRPQPTASDVSGGRAASAAVAADGEAADGVAADGEAADPVWDRLLEVDPENRLLGRMRRRRLEGEAIRDALLTASGRLDRRLWGPGVRPPLPPEVVRTLLKDQWPTTPDVAAHDRRSIYLFVRRNLRYPLFEAFDRPDPNLSCSRRQVSTTAPQALALLNSEWTQQVVAQLSARLAAETAEPSQPPRDRISPGATAIPDRGAGEREPRAPDPIEARFDRACQLLYGRRASPAERSAARAWLAAAGPDGWHDLLLALVNANEFVYVD